MHAASSALTLCLCLTLAACPVEPAQVEAPVAESVKAPVAEPVAQPAAEPTEAPAAKPAEALVAKPAEAPSVKPDEEPVAKPAAKPIFNPADPPEGFSRCQGGECHTADGRILTYKQVMAEVGAEQMAGGLDPSRLPAAPDDVAGPPSDVERTASGLASRVLRAGTGAVKPGPTSTVQVHYSGWTTDGEAFDSSVARGRPAGFPLGRVIPGWQEGIQLMVEGEKRRLWIPESLAYKGRPGGPAGMLVFDIELLKILRP